MGAVVLMTSLGLAACGSDETSGGSGGEVAVGEEAGTELTEENFFSEVTDAQVEAKSSHVSMDMGAEAGGIKAEGDVVMGESAEDTAMTMTMDSGEASMGTIEMRLVEGIFYMNFGDMTQGKFVEMDLSDESNPLGAQFGSMTDNFDPAKQLEVLEEAVTGFEQKGDAEEIDGVEATPYEITVDSSKIVGQLGEGAAGAEAEMPEEIAYTMFVGPDNLPRRVVVDMAGTSMAMDYSKWGEEVAVEKPSEDEITTESPFGEMGG